MDRLDIDIDTSKDIKDRSHNTWHSIKSWKYHDVTEHGEMEEIKHTTGAIKGNNREMRKYKKYTSSEFSGTDEIRYSSDKRKQIFSLTTTFRNISMKLQDTKVTKKKKILQVNHKEETDELQGTTTDNRLISSNKGNQKTTHYLQSWEKIVNLEFYIAHNYDSKVKTHKYIFGRKKKTEFTLHRPSLEREERKKRETGKGRERGKEKKVRKTKEEPYQIMLIRKKKA